jgi:hypothetical protein
LHVAEKDGNFSKPALPPCESSSPSVNPRHDIMKSTLRRRFALAAVVIGLHCMLTHRAPAQDANSKLAASADPSAGASAQRPEKPNVVELARGWLIKMGDDLSWSSPAFDDSRWERIHVGRSWENQGHVCWSTDFCARLTSTQLARSSQVIIASATSRRHYVQESIAS